MADYDWFDRAPTQNEIAADRQRQRGFYPVWVEWQKKRNNPPDYYQCQRGCGCLVWSPEHHAKNVCKEYNG